MGIQAARRERTVAKAEEIPFVAAMTASAHDAPVARPRSMLQLRLQEPATPAHVERAGRMFAQALEAVGVSDAGVTLVIENDRLVGTLRTRTTSAAAGVQSIVDFVQRPVGVLSSPADPAHVALADALAKYARDEHKARPELWQPGKGRPRHLCTMDETFANVMEVLANAPVMDTQRVRGITYVHTVILRVGRVDERQLVKVRIVVDGRPLDVPVAEGLASGPFFDAAKTSQVVRIRLRASWLHVAGERPTLRDPIVIGIDESKPAASGARIVELAQAHNVISADDLPPLLRSLDRGGNEDE